MDIHEVLLMWHDEVNSSSLPWAFGPKFKKKKESRVLGFNALKPIIRVKLDDCKIQV